MFETRLLGLAVRSLAAVEHRAAVLARQGLEHCRARPCLAEAEESAGLNARAVLFQEGPPFPGFQCQFFGGWLICRSFRLTWQL